METHRTKKKHRHEPADPLSIEREVRQLLADKISGTMVGVWLLVAEHLRLGTWDLLCGWTGQGSERVEPRLALQLVHEAALCVRGVRQRRCLSQKGFEVANGLPFVATDTHIHDLCSAQTIAGCQALQIALGRLRRASGHFKGHLLAIDPHRLHSYTKRQTRLRRSRLDEQPVKTLQTFFCLDTDTHQPLAFSIGTAAKTTSQAIPDLLSMVNHILQPEQGKTLVLADNEHYTADIFDHLSTQTALDLLVPMTNCPAQKNKLSRLSPDSFTPRWPGLATASLPFNFKNSSSGTLFRLIQRLGETPHSYQYKSFLSTSTRDELIQLCYNFPDRWHVEEFFNAYQAMGWKRAGTLNLNTRYAQMCMALIAQTVVYQLRSRLGQPYFSWEASHFAKNLLQGLDGDVRVTNDTIIVTFYNAPHIPRLRKAYETLPAKLQKDNIDPRVPWLFNFKLDFRFK